MTQKVTHFTISENKTVEKLLENDDLSIAHVVLPARENLAPHETNSNMYMIVVRGEVALRLDGVDERIHAAGSVVAIPFGAKMDIANGSTSILEFFVVKAPGPAAMARRRTT